MKSELLKIILLDWTRRVIEDCDKRGICPLPWSIRETLREVFEMLNRIEGADKYSAVDDEGYSGDINHNV